MKKIWIAILLLTLVGLGIYALQQNSEISRLKESPVTITRVVTQKVKVANNRFNSHPPEGMAQNGDSSLTGKGTLTVNADPAAPGTNFAARMTAMAQDPQFKEMMRNQQKMMVGQMYRGLDKHLNLPTEKMDALKDLLSERQMALAEAGLAMLSGKGLVKETAEKAKATKSDYDSKIEQLLGAQDYPVFKQFEDTQGERMQVQMFKGNLSSDNALTDQQQEDLIAALYQERQSMPALSKLSHNQAPDPAMFSEENIAQLTKELEDLQQRYTESAAKVLTPAQMEQFTKFQTQWQSMQTFGLKMAAKMFTKPAAPAASPTP